MIFPIHTILPLLYILLVLSIRNKKPNYQISVRAKIIVAIFSIATILVYLDILDVVNFGDGLAELFIGFGYGFITLAMTFLLLSNIVTGRRFEGDIFSNVEKKPTFTILLSFIISLALSFVSLVLTGPVMNDEPWAS